MPVSFRESYGPYCFLHENDLLCEIPDLDLIKHVVLSLKSSKSLGLDGKSPLFYKAYWSIVGNKLIVEVQYFFASRNLPEAINHTFLAMFLKLTTYLKLTSFTP